MSVRAETLWVSSTVMVAGFARGDVTGSMLLLASLLQHDGGSDARLGPRLSCIHRPRPWQAPRRHADSH